MNIEAHMDANSIRDIYRVMIKNESIVCNNKMKREERQQILSIVSQYLQKYVNNPTTISYIFKTVRLFDYLYLNSDFLQKLSFDKLYRFLIILMNVFVDDKSLERPSDVMTDMGNFLELVGDAVFHSPTIYDFLLIYSGQYRISKNDLMLFFMYAVEWLGKSDGLPSASALAIINFVTGIDVTGNILDMNSYVNTFDMIRQIDPKECLFKESKQDSTSLNSATLEPEESEIITGRKLASGSFGTVYEVVDDPYIVIKSFMEITDFLLELVNVVNLKHYGINSISRLYPGSFNSLIFSRAWIDLQRYVTHIPEPMSKILIRSYMSQLTETINYCHNNMIAHLDLKPGNTVLYNNGVIQIIDFGAAQTFNPYGENKNRYSTTYLYAPPEYLITNPYYFKSINKDTDYVENKVVERLISYPAIDMWSLGMIFLFMLTQGRLSYFRSVDILHGINNLMENETWETVVHNIDPLEADFLSKLLKYDPRDRLTASQAVNHEYIRGFRQTVSKHISENANN